MTTLSEEAELLELLGPPPTVAVAPAALEPAKRKNSTVARRGRNDYAPPYAYEPFVVKPGAGEPTPHLPPDRKSVEPFLDAMFRHADPQTFVSLRAFDDISAAPPLFAQAVAVGDVDIVARVCDGISQAANHPRPHVFCPPICTFKTAHNAKTENLADGLVITVECDSNAQAAREDLVAILGLKPTLVVGLRRSVAQPANASARTKITFALALVEASANEGRARTAYGGARARG
jgi:hypothetical protein